MDIIVAVIRRFLREVLELITNMSSLNHHAMLMLAYTGFMAFVLQ